MVTENISNASSDNFEAMSTIVEDENSITPQTNENYSIFYQVIQDKKLEEIKLLLKDKTLINAPVQTTGSLAGYTPLHVACMKGDEELVKMLIEDYHADVNVVAEDGAQPIHLACLFLSLENVEALLQAGADIDAEITRDILSKHMKNKIWRDNFGDKVTLLTYALLYRVQCLAELLLDNHANSKIKDCKNKTLLMYALETEYKDTARTIVLNEKGDQEYLNARDDDGYCAIHYIFHPDKYEGSRYVGLQVMKDPWKFNCLFTFCEWFPDIYATVNGDPDTLFLNMAAYRSSCHVLKKILPWYNDIKLSKALYLATLPFEYSKESFPTIPGLDERFQHYALDIHRENSVELILKDLVNRVEFGFSVPEEEKKLMEKLIATDNDIRELVNNYKQKVLHGVLKNTVIEYRNKSMTFYDFILVCADDKKLQLLVKDEIFMEAYRSVHSNLDGYYFCNFCTMKVKHAYERNDFLDKLKTVDQLRKAIPLPYECVLDMIEFLNNNDLGTFIYSFFTFV